MTRSSILAPILLIVILSHASAAPDRPPGPKVEFLKPTPGQELTGTIDIHLKVTSQTGGGLPSSVYAGLGGAPWLQLEQVEGANEWTGQVDTTLTPNGAHKLLVVTNNKRLRASVPVTVNNPLRVFFSDLHSHTGYSDGTLTPAIAHAYARDAAELNVFSLTDHLESVDETEWTDTREVVWDANEDGKFVVIPGLEWTKKWGHLNIFDPKTRHWPNNAEAFYQRIADADVVAKFNHPGDGTKSHSGLAYSAIGDKAVQMMEVRQPAEEQAFIRALDNGWHLAPEGSSDTHSANWGNVRSWTGILAPGLSKRCIWDAMKRRHVYSTLDRNCQLSFTVNGAIMGDIVPRPATMVEVVVKVENPDRTDKIAKIELFENGKVAQVDEPGASSRQWRTTRSPEPGKYYYFVKVTQADGNLLWSAPVWVLLTAG